MYCTNNEPLKKHGILNQDLGSDPDQQATDNQQLSNIGVHLEVHPYMHNWLGLPNEHFGPNLRISRPASSAKCTFGAIFALLASPRPPRRKSLAPNYLSANTL